MLKMILGLDLSSTSIGWATINDDSLIAFGLLKIKKDKKQNEKWLAEIYEGIAILLLAHKPTLAIVEGSFYAQNIRTTQILSRSAQFST